MEKKQVFLTEAEERALDRKRRDELKEYRKNRRTTWFMKS